MILAPEETLRPSKGASFLDLLGSAPRRALADAGLDELSRRVLACSGEAEGIGHRSFLSFRPPRRPTSLVGSLAEEPSVAAADDID